jgi:hypothetical protein
VSIGGTVPKDLERAPLTVGEEPVVETAPRKEPVTPGEWVRRNLFSSWANGVMTVVTGAVVLYVAFRLLRFVFVTAEWDVLKANLRVYMVGRFPLEETGRVWTVAYLLAVLAGLSRGAMAPARWTLRGIVLRAALALLGVGALLYLIESALVWLLLGVAVALYAAAVLLHLVVVESDADELFEPAIDFLMRDHPGLLMCEARSPHGRADRLAVM